MQLEIGNTHIYCVEAVIQAVDGVVQVERHFHMQRDESDSIVSSLVQKFNHIRIYVNVW